MGNAISFKSILEAAYAKKTNKKYPYMGTTPFDLVAQSNADGSKLGVCCRRAIILICTMNVGLLVRLKQPTGAVSQDSRNPAPRTAFWIKLFKALFGLHRFVSSPSVRVAVINMSSLKLLRLSLSPPCCSERAFDLFLDKT